MKLQAPQGRPSVGRPRPFIRRANPKAPWEERFAVLFEDLRKPARVLINRAYGSAICAEEIEDVYSNAWTSTLQALGGRERHMPEHELRSYVLTSVSNHASKEMRRRRRRPTAELEDAHAQSIADRHQPAPEELAVGAESQLIVRDLLASLPPRRRAVMLLRYGWGMAPAEICATIPGLSSRAYRKEVTRGVGELIERLALQESGEWCRSREPLLRDYVAGTADGERQRQAAHHLSHCHSCNEVVAKLSGQLHDFGATVAWTSVVTTVGEQKLSLVERAGAGVDRLREGAAGAVDRGEAAAEVAAPVLTSGGARGTGTAASGGILAAIGGGGAKLAAICGGTAAAGACVAAVALPGSVDPFGLGESSKPEANQERSVERLGKAAKKLSASIPVAIEDIAEAEQPRPQPNPDGGSGGGGTSGSSQPSTPTPAPEPEPAPAPAAPPPVQAQTDPVAAASMAPAAQSPPPASAQSAGSSAGSGSGGGGSGDGEFGP